MDMDPVTQQSLEALASFKDWSNYLLVTTVAALGWSAKKEVIVGSPRLRRWTLCFLALSIVFAIFTLGLIPLVASSPELARGTSIYDVAPSFDLLWISGEISFITLKHVCWWQHIFFLAGIAFFVAAMWEPSETLRCGE